MKKVIIILLLTFLIAYLFSRAEAQQQFFMVHSSGAPAGGRTFYLNFTRDAAWLGSALPGSPWNNTATAFEGWLSADGVSVTNMTTSTGAASTVDATNPAAINTMTGIVLNTGGADAGVWIDKVIISNAIFAHNATYQFNQLDNTKTYDIYFHFDTNHYDGWANVQATVGGSSTTARNPNGNHGEGLGTGLANTALDKLEDIAPSTGTITITFTSAGGAGAFIPVTSIVLVESN